MVRLKHRYIVTRILYPSMLLPAPAKFPMITNLQRPTPSLDVPQLIRLIRNSVAYMYGDYGLGLISSSLKINYYSQSTSTMIIRVARAHYRILWAALTWLNGTTEPDATAQRQKGVECVFRTVRVCGTIRKAEEEIIEMAKKDIRRAKSEATSAADPVARLSGPSQIGATDTRSRKRRKLGRERGSEAKN